MRPSLGSRVVGGLVVVAGATWGGTRWMGAQTGLGVDRRAPEGPAEPSGAAAARPPCLHEGRACRARADGSCAWLEGFNANRLNGTVRAFAVFDDGSEPALYAGGWFTTAGGVTVNRVARWDGLGWSSLSGPADVGTNAPVEALAGLDGTSGPELVAGGDFTTAGGVPSSGIAGWRCPSPDFVFADGLESGDTSAWSLALP